VVRRARGDDRAPGLVTARLLGAAARRPACAQFVAEGRLVVAGLPIVALVYAELDHTARVEALRVEGECVAPGAVLARVRASAATLLSGERVALNFLQRLSGVATLTRRVVEAVAGTGGRVTHTRKTTPGPRALGPYAVTVGGCVGAACGAGGDRPGVGWHHIGDRACLRGGRSAADLDRRAHPLGARGADSTGRPPPVKPTTFARFPSPLGELVLTASDTALTGVFFPVQSNRSPEEQSGWVEDDGRGPAGGLFARARRHVTEYFDRTRTTFDLPLDATGSPFERRVWDLLRTIPYGATT